MKTSPGNILLVANWESNVGYAWWLMENFWTTISSHFEKQGTNSYLMYPKITQIPNSIADSNITTYECDFHNRSLTNINKICTFIRTNNIKFIYLSDSPAYSFFYIILKLCGVKKIVIHDHTPGERTKPPTWLRLIKTIIHLIPLYTADHFIAVTDFVLNRFIQISCLPQRKCSVASNGIKPINLNNANLNYMYDIFPIPRDRKIVITTGRASYYKGIDFFIECANELVNKQNLKKLHFIFCGNGPDLRDFKDLAKKLGVENHFTFAGKRNDIQKILPCCHIGFHAATGEVGYSLSILEYMSAGLVTIVPETPSTSLATTHLKNGLTYPYRNLLGATNTIKQALDITLSTSITCNAISIVKDKFHIDNTNANLIEILNPIFK